MAKTWLQLRVDLLGASGEELEPAPGRVFIVGPGQSFERLAVAINQAFARWDHSHLHEFELADARKIGYPDDEGDIGPGWEDHAALKVTEELTPGDEFSFTYDLGDEWRHRCRVLADKVDPREEYGPGPLPKQPVAIWGWGEIPDQYGRTSAEELELDD